MRHALISLIPSAILGLIVMAADSRGAAQEAPTQLEVVVENAELQGSADSVRVVLIDAFDREYTRFSGVSYRGSRPVLVGDQALVYVHGYEPHLGVIQPELPHAVRLEPCSAHATLRPTDPRFEGQELRIRNRFRLPGSSITLNLFDQVAKWGAGVLTVPTSERFETSAQNLYRGPELSWPLRCQVGPGSEVTFQIEETEQVQIEIPEELIGGPSDVACLTTPDLTDRLAWSADRMDALLFWMLREKIELRIRGSVGVLTRPRGLPVHLFVSAGAISTYQRIPATPGQPVVLGATPRRQPGRPLIDSAPAPAGTYLVCGRVDHSTLQQVIRSPWYSRFFATQIGSGDATEVALPHTDWITAWHPERGMSYLRWSTDGRPEGDFETGQLAIHFPDGYRASGVVRILRAPKGNASLVLNRFEDRSELNLDLADEARIRGLAAGDYHIEMELVCSTDDSALSMIARRVMTIETGETAALVIPPPP